MAIIDLGSIGFIFRGEWQEDTLYRKNDVVSHDNSSWICVADCQGRTPADGSEYWRVMAKGAGLASEDTPGVLRLATAADIAEGADDAGITPKRLPEALAGVGPNVIRTPMAGDLTLYVRADGDDANDGLTEPTAFATIQAAIDGVCRYDARNWSVCIDVGPGVFAGFTVKMENGNGTLIRISGAGEQTRIACAPDRELSIGIYQPRRVEVANVRLDSFVYAADGAELVLTGTIVFAPAVPSLSNLMYARRGGKIRIRSENFILRGTETVISYLMCAADTGSGIGLDSVTAVFFEDGFAVTTAGVRVCFGATINWNQGSTVSGEMTGRKYRIDGGGLLDTGNNDPDSFLPGDTPGVIYPYALSGDAGALFAGARIQGDGTILGKPHNIASVDVLEEGKYRINFLRPHPVTHYYNVAHNVTSERPAPWSTVLGTTAKEYCVVTVYNANNVQTARAFSLLIQ